MTLRTSLKPKRCAACKEVFTPSRSMQRVCGPGCALALALKQRAQKAAKADKENRKSFRVAIEKAKTRGAHLKELQAAFNAWVRCRDAGLPCISCGRPASWQGQWDAGHYLSRGSSPAIRFDSANVHKQCLPCNRHLSGNLVLFRINLIQRIGLAEVERLEGPHEPLKMTLAEIQDMKTFYRAEVRRLKKVAA